MENFFRENGVKWLWEKIKTLLSAKQDQLVSGSNIKTVNGESLLGHGNVSISGGSGGDFEYKEIQLSPSNADAIIPRYINSSNVWAVQNNTDVACLFLVHKGDKIKIQANAYYYSVYTLLTTKDINYNITPPPFVGDWRRTVVDTNQEVEFEIPQRCYLYIYNKSSNGSNYFPKIANRNAVFTGLSEVAFRADKLSTARTISLNGGASGSVSFDGSADKSLDVTNIDEGYLKFSSRDIAGNTTIIDALLRDSFGNKIAFMEPSSIQIEYSQDNGETWADYEASDADKITFVTPLIGDRPLALGKRQVNDNTALTDRLRITLDAIEGNVYFVINKILIKTANGVVARQNFKVDIDYKTYGGSDWITYKTVRLKGSPGWSSISSDGLPNFGYIANSHIRYLRFTFRQETFTDYKGLVSNIAILSLRNVTGGNNLTNKGTIYRIDTNKNVFFPAAIISTKFVTQNGTNQQVVLGDGTLKDLDEISPITDADAEILLDNHIHSINVNANDNDVNISVRESSKNGNNWDTEDNDITIPLATTENAGVMSKEDKAKLDGGNVAIDDDSGMPDLIGDYYDDVDMVAEISLRQYYQPLTEGCLYLINAIEGGSQCIIMFIYRSDGCIPISTTNTNTMKASISGTTLKITGTDGSGELRIKQIKLK